MAHDSNWTSSVGSEPSRDPRKGKQFELVQYGRKTDCFLIPRIISSFLWLQKVSDANKQLNTWRFIPHVWRNAFNRLGYVYIALKTSNYRRLPCYWRFFLPCIQLRSPNCFLIRVNLSIVHKSYYILHRNARQTVYIIKQIVNYHKSQMVRSRRISWEFPRATWERIFTISGHQHCFVCSLERKNRRLDEVDGYFSRLYVFFWFGVQKDSTLLKKDILLDLTWLKLL